MTASELKNMDNWISSKAEIDMLEVKCAGRQVLRDAFSAKKSHSQISNRRHEFYISARKAT